MTISMSAVWDESLVLLKRERQLLVPLALATIGIGSAASALIRPETVQAGTSVTTIAAMLAANLLNLIGSLAIIALVLKPGLSVAEGLRLAIARMPKIFAFVLLSFFAIVVAAMPIGLTMTSGAISAQTAFSDLPPLALLLTLVGLLILVYFGLRLVTLNVIIIDTNPPLGTAINAAFAQSQGLVLKLIGVTLLFFIVGAVLSGAILSVLGSLFTLIGESLGLPLLGKTIGALAGGMIDALLSMLAAVFVTKLYQKLSAQ